MCKTLIINYSFKKISVYPLVREKLLIVFFFILKAGAITATGTSASTLGATMASTVFGALGGAKLISYYLCFSYFYYNYYCTDNKT